MSRIWRIGFPIFLWSKNRRRFNNGGSVRNISWVADVAGRGIDGFAMWTKVRIYYSEDGNSWRLATELEKLGDGAIHFDGSIALDSVPVRFVHVDLDRCSASYCGGWSNLYELRVMG